MIYMDIYIYHFDFEAIIIVLLSADFFYQLIIVKNSLLFFKEDVFMKNNQFVKHKIDLLTSQKCFKHYA